MNRAGRTPSHADRSLNWIHAKKSEVELMKYGKNKRSVTDARDAMLEKQNQAKNYEKESKVAQQTTNAEGAKDVDSTYKSLTETIEKKLRCLQTMMEVAGLEDSCGTLSSEFDAKAVHLVSSDERRKVVGQETGDQLPGFISPSAQDCIFATRDNWDWIIKLVDCIKFHLVNASEYHQFFHEVDESSGWLEQDIERLEDTFDVNKFKGDYEDAKRLLRELEDMGRILRQWDAKTQHMWERANKVVPVNLRTEGVTVDLPCRSIAEYETKEIHVREGEDLLLLDNSKSNMWKVRNARGQQAEIPALCVLIPGPTNDGLEAAARLRMKLLACWTNTLKRIGKRLLCFMLLVFKPVYDEDEIALLRGTQNIEKADLLRILDFIEESMRTHWGDHEGFIELQERMLALRMILEEAGDNPMQDEGTYKALVVQVTMLEELMKKYRDLWDEWEKHKVALETSRSPELMLMVDKWQQLQFVSKSYMTKFWQNELKFDDFEKSLSSLQSMVDGDVHNIHEIDDSVAKETIETSNYKMASRLMSQGSFDMGDGSYGYGEMTLTSPKLGPQGSSGSGEGSFGQGFTITKESVTSQRSSASNDGTTKLGTQGSTGSGEGSFGQGFTITKESVKSQSSGASNEGTTKLGTQGSSGSGEGSFGQGFTITKESVSSLGSTPSNEATTTFDEGSSGYGESTVTTTTTRMTSQNSQGSQGMGQAQMRMASISSMGSSGEGSYGYGEFTESTGTIEESILNSKANVFERQPSVIEPTEFGVAHETRTAETEQLLSAQMEEQKTFIIRSVVDPRTEKEISFNDAIMEGIINAAEGVYVNPVTYERYPIPVAMTAGLIKVSFTTTKRSREKKSTIGIITVKTTRETVKPYKIISVKNLKTGENMEQRPASKAGIIDEQRGIYKDNTTGREMLLSDAIDAGHVKVEYTDAPSEPETVTKAYAVRAVVDRRMKTTVTFQEAVRRGILLKESCEFRDTLTGNTMYIGDAIMRGFLKARQIDNPHSLNIDPENRLVIDKTDIIRKKLLQPLGVISAFRKAAKMAGGYKPKVNN